MPTKLLLAVLLLVTTPAWSQFEDPLSDQLEDSEFDLDPEQEAEFAQDDIGSEDALESELEKEFEESELDVAEEGSESLPEELDDEIEEELEEELAEEAPDDLEEDLEKELEEEINETEEQLAEDDAAQEELEVVAQEDQPEEAPEEVDAQAVEESIEESIEPEPPVEPLVPEAPSVPERVADAPDDSTESLFHQLFQNYYNEPVDQKQWNDLVNNRGSQVYNVQSGDTLWGLSKVFFADGAFWPKIWSYNSSVTNPHQIEPGYEVRFLLGDADSAPFIAIGPAGSIGTADPVLAQESSSPKVPLAPVVKPLLENLPPSLPAWTKVDEEKAVTVSKTPVEESTAGTLRLMSEFVKQDKNYIGEVVEVAGGKLAANLGGRLYIEAKKEVLTPGKRITIVRVGDKVKADGKSARLHHIVGEVVIEGFVEEDQTRKVDSDNSLYVGRVESSFELIKKGTRLIDMPVIYANYAEGIDVSKEIDESINTQMVDSFGVSSVYRGKILHLNRGQEAGLSAGNVVPFFQKIKKSPYLDESVERIGYVKILHPEAEFSTGIVVDVLKK